MAISVFKQRKNAIGNGVFILNSLESDIIWFSMVYVLFVVLCFLSSMFFLDVCFLLELMMLFWLCYVQQLHNYQSSTDAGSM